MSNTTFSVKAIAFFLLVIMSSCFLLALAKGVKVQPDGGFDVDSSDPYLGKADTSSGSSASSKVSKTAKSGKNKYRKSGTQLVTEVIDILSMFGGEAVEQVIEDFKTNIHQTTSLLQSLASENTIDSVNFLLRSAISSLGDAARHAASENDTSTVMASSDFSEFLDSFRATVLKKCKAKSNFASGILPQVEAVMPSLLQGLSELYENVHSSTGFGLTFGMLSQGTMLLSFFERPEYVSKDTFKSFVDFPTEIQGQFEHVIEELIDSYNVDQSQIDMVLGMARMAAQNFASSSSRRHEKEEL